MYPLLTILFLSMMAGNMVRCVQKIDGNEWSAAFLDFCLSFFSGAMALHFLRLVK